MAFDRFEIVLVEDDDAIGSLVMTTLDLRGYRCFRTSDGASAILAVATRRPDLILLDLGLPDMDGTEVIEKVREWSDIPIIVLSARLEDSDKVAALDAGADDYLVKPFSVEELMARIRVALRRAEPRTGIEGVYRNGELEIDYAAGVVSLADRDVHLTPMEYKLLCVLARNTGKVLTHNFILKEVWGSTRPSDMASLRVFMTTLRRKIESDPSHPCYIQTHVGVGYRMMKVDSRRL